MNDNQWMLSRGLAFLVWALVAASTLYWGLQLFVAAPQAPANTAGVAPSAIATSDLTRLLGVDAPPVVEAAAAPAADARFQLVGVVAPRTGGASREGVALIAVDGKPARASRVGAVVDGDRVLQSVQSRGANLGPRRGPVNISLQLPPLPVAATSTLPPAGAAALVQPVAPTVLPPQLRRLQQQQPFVPPQTPMLAQPDMPAPPMSGAAPTR